MQLSDTSMHGEHVSIPALVRYYSFWRMTTVLHPAHLQCRRQCASLRSHTHRGYANESFVAVMALMTVNTGEQ